MKDLSKISDEKLTVYIREKDKEAFKEIIERYESKLLRYAEYLVGDQDRAADIVQETFIKSFVNLNGYNANKKFSSWIYRIAHNEAMSILRKNRKIIPMFENIEIDSGVNVEEDMIRKELVAHANKCLGSMPIIYREPLSLYYLEDKSYEEISDILRIPTGTVGTRINRAKLLMKKICQKIKK